MSKKKPVIAVDAMTAERGYDVVVKGVEQAVRKYRSKILLIGSELYLKHAVKNPRDIEIVDCEQVIGHDESPFSYARKEESSQAVGVQIVKDGEADAFISAGNSGATGYFAQKYLENLEGVENTPIIQQIPSKTRRYPVVGDLGFYLEYNADQLFNAAIMMEAYFREMYGINRPRVALLTVGSEPTKGSSEVKAAHKLLREISDQSPLNIYFVGNMEPEDVFNGLADCFVCNGEVGNVFLKTVESTAKFVRQESKRAFLSPLSLLLSLPAIIGFPGICLSYKKIKKKFSPSTYGGALILGIGGNIIITHGGSDLEAIAESVRFAQEVVKHNIPNTLEEAISRYSSD